MRKIPTVFLRNNPDDPHHVTHDVNPAAEWVLTSDPADVVATRKYDGTCVMLDDNAQWWARREVKPGKSEPSGWVLADVDEVTGKRMGWVPIEPGWQFFAMYREAIEGSTSILSPGTYELCGPKINGNPEGFELHTLIRHADAERLDPALPRDYNSLAAILTGPTWTYEGIVWHASDGRMAKLKRKDFGRPAPRPQEEASRQEAIPMSIEFALLRPEGPVEFVTADGDLFGLIKRLVPDATPRQLGPLMMWDADTYTAEMPYNPVTEAVIGQGVGYYPGHDWRGPCVVTMAEGPGGIPTLSAEVRDWITLWAAPAVKGRS